MKNFVQKGRTVTVTAPYNRSSGQGTQVGSIFGVAANDATSGDTNLELQIEGVFDITKDTSTFSQGDVVYWDNSAKKCSSTAGIPVGSATQAQLTGDATVRVRLNDDKRIAATVAAVATADADSTYGSPEATLINELKTQVNAALAALKAAGLMK